MSNHFNYRVTTNHCERFALEKVNTIENPLSILLERGVAVEEVRKMTKKRKLGVLNLKKPDQKNDGRWIEQKYATKLQIRDNGTALSWDVFRDFYGLDDDQACRLEYHCVPRSWEACEERLARAGVRSIKLCDAENMNMDDLSDYRAAPIICVTDSCIENCTLEVRCIDNVLCCMLHGVDFHACGGIMIVEFDTAEAAQRDAEFTAMYCYDTARGWVTSQSIGHNTMSAKAREWIQQEYPDLWEANEKFRKAQKRCYAFNSIIEEATRNGAEYDSDVSSEILRVLKTRRGSFEDDLIRTARDVEMEWAEFVDSETEYYRKDFPQDCSAVFYEFRDAIYVAGFRCSGGEYAYPERKIAIEGHERPEWELEL